MNKSVFNLSLRALLDIFILIHESGKIMNIFERLNPRKMLEIWLN